MNFEKKNSIYKIMMTIVVTAIITLLVSSVIFYNYYLKTNRGNIEALSKHITLSDSTNELENKIEILKKYLEDKYIGELQEDKMLEHALKGYVEGLGDKYTEYLTSEELEELMISVNGNYVGIGVYMTKNNNDEVVVLMPIEGSPAEEQGLQTGDIIEKVDGTQCKGMELSDVSNMIKGEEGTTVNIDLIRDENTINVDVERRTVELKYMDSKILDNNIGHIRMISFEDGCSEKLREEISKLKSQGVTSFVLDFRDNGGGLVTEAIAVSEIFVPMGKVILKTYDKEGNEKVTKSMALTTESDIKFVLLVNEKSASATEIFAAALQDNNIAKVIGTTTFGKGINSAIKNWWCFKSYNRRI